MSTFKELKEVHKNQALEVFKMEKMPHLEQCIEDTANATLEWVVDEAIKKVKKLKMVDRLDNNGMETVIRMQVLDELDHLKSQLDV